MSIQKRKQAQGYLPSNKRPMCSNCENEREYQCMVGCFRVTESAWCPWWKPDGQWLEKHPDVAAIMDLKNKEEKCKAKH